MQDTLTSGLIDLLLAMTTLAGGALIAAIRRHFSLRTITAAEAVARIAVRAAEQMAEAAGWDSAAKLAMALAGARDLAAAHGVTLSDTQWRQLIEREVALLRRLDRELIAPRVGESQRESQSRRMQCAPTSETGGVEIDDGGSTAASIVGARRARPLGSPAEIATESVEVMTIPNEGGAA